MEENLRILILEDVPTDSELVERELRKDGLEFTSVIVESREDFLEQMEGFAPHVVLSDYMMPQFTGRKALQLINERYPNVPLIIVTGSMNEETAVECMKNGAADYVIKEHLARLGSAVRNVLKNQQLKEEKEEAQRQVQQRAIEWLATVDALGDAICILDEDYRIVRANKAMQAMTGGRPFHDIIGNYCWALMHGTTAPIENCPIVAMRKSGRKEAVELNVNGRTLYVQVYPFPDAAKMPHMAVHTITDITERKKATEELARSARELARSNADLEQYARLASHDLKEPLRMITGYIQLIERRYREHFDDDGRLFMQYVVDGALRMQGLIDALLAYSRVGRKEVDIKPTDIKKVVDTAVGNLHVAIDESRATITYDDLPTVPADGAMLASLFQNLLANAIKYRSAKPSCVHIGAELTGEGWRFSVRDNGIGIDARYADRIFLMFQHLQNREDYTGTGIGLAIARKIVELHHGRIWFESIPGEGTTFYFTLSPEGGG